MKPILLQAELPPNVTLIVKPQKEYQTCFNIYIKGHWLRSWIPINISAYDIESATQKFIECYYGTTVTTDTNKYPEHFI